jgi:hypothetical protein
MKKGPTRGPSVRYISVLTRMLKLQRATVMVTGLSVKVPFGPDPTLRPHERK